ncbi:MAG TPA: hypothetical protein VG371_03510 [Solirubrobacteraceae bacterium]|jgi:hypothetical protein|nr:hypothetical protein [Solirubrobacteraceae bacterium]
MTPPRRFTLVAAIAAATLVIAAAAIAAGGVTPARGSTRSSLVHAFVVQDGASTGITGVYTAGSHAVLGVVCQKTPDRGTVRFLFRRSARSWRYLFSAAGAGKGTAVERQLERACR